MSFKTVTTFPIFIPIPSLTTITTSPTTTEIRFSRWNNANADKFNHLRRTQQQIQDDLRRLRRFETADNLTSLPSTTNTTTHTFKSTGTPSSPSLPSIPGKKSKYSKPPNPNPNPRFDTAVRVRGNGTFRNGRGETGLTVAGNGPSRSPSRNESAIVVDADETFRNVERNGLSHPAFRKVNRKTRLPFRNEEGVIVEPSRNGEGETGVYDVETFRDGEGKRGVGVKVNEDGLTYVVDGAPFEFQYSYTETPKVKPLALRESPVAPFGPGTMPRPWTGRKPFPPSKKNLPEFDSFNPPPAGKKGVKPVQKPGPFLDGSGPRYVKTREEILGEVLTRDEVVELVEGCRKTKRQLNMGRDGLTHNMLDNIHAHWKRRRVCKIKCKGVCTVDMDNVCQQLEEKSGGKIIYHRGGIVYLFRGRNYNYKTRPRYPLMLWKPIAPVYPRLIKRIPEGLTLEEASDMRKRGRDLPPICKLGKNGVYVNLVKDVKEAFEACELVRVDCQGLNPSDYRKIGAKLKDLVPCVLISFENEHILMWRGRDWKSSYFPDEDGSMGVKSTENDSAASQSLYDDLLASEDDEDGDGVGDGDGDGDEEANEEMAKGSIDLTDSDVDVGVNSFGKDFVPFEVNDQIRPHASALENETMLNSDILSDNDIKFIHQLETGTSEKPNSTLIESDSRIDKGQQGIIQNNSEEGSPSVSDSSCQDGVLLLLKQAVEDGSAMILDNSSLDADMVFERSVEFALVAPPGPVFRHRPRKIRIQTVEDQDSGDTEVNKEVVVSENKPNVKKPKERKSSRTSKTKDFKEDYSNLVPQGSLKVDELAKLLA